MYNKHAVIRGLALTRYIQLGVLLSIERGSYHILQKIRTHAVCLMWHNHTVFNKTGVGVVYISYRPFTSLCSMCTSCIKLTMCAHALPTKGDLHEHIKHQ